MTPSVTTAESVRSESPFVDIPSSQSYIGSKIAPTIKKGLGKRSLPDEHNALRKGNNTSICDKFS